MNDDDKMMNLPLRELVSPDFSAIMTRVQRRQKARRWRYLAVAVLLLGAYFFAPTKFKSAPSSPIIAHAVSVETIKFSWEVAAENGKNNLADKWQVTEFDPLSTEDL